MDKKGNKKEGIRGLLIEVSPKESFGQVSIPIAIGTKTLRRSPSDKEQPKNRHSKSQGTAEENIVAVIWNLILVRRSEVSSPEIDLHIHYQVDDKFNHQLFMSRIALGYQQGKSREAIVVDLGLA